MTMSASGGGNDTFFWNIGDDNDVVNGQGGIDTFRFTGSMGDDIVPYIGKQDGKIEFFSRASRRAVPN